MTRTIKITNVRRGGNLFHYAHFLTDCLLPEVLAGVQAYDRVVRLRTIHQTLGNFSTMYTAVMGLEHCEILPEDFDSHEGDNIVIDSVHYKKNLSLKDIQVFRNHIYSQFGIEPSRKLPLRLWTRWFHFWSWKQKKVREPDIFLIKRHAGIELVSDPHLSAMNRNRANGSERREIAEIDRVEEHLRKTYGARIQTLELEFIPFAEQVLYFNKARLIIAAHGAALSNMLFCTPGCRIIEVSCNTNWAFFDVISRLLRLDHVKCHDNSYEAVVRCIAKYSV